MWMTQQNDIHQNMIHQKALIIWFMNTLKWQEIQLKTLIQKTEHFTLLHILQQSSNAHQACNISKIMYQKGRLDKYQNITKHYI